MSSKKINSYCVICGKGYHICKSCQEIAHLNPWRMIADTPNCYQIYTALSEYNGGLITKEQARERLESRNLKDKDTFKERVRNTINEIMDEPKKARRVTKHPIVQTDTIEDTGVLTTDVADSADTNNCEQN